MGFKRTAVTRSVWGDAGFDEETDSERSGDRVETIFRVSAA